MVLSFFRKIFGQGEKIVSIAESTPPPTPLSPRSDSPQRRLENIIVTSMFGNSLETVLDKMQRFSDREGMSPADIKQAVESSLDRLVVKCMDDGILSKEEEQALLGLLKHFEIPLSSLDKENHQLLAKGEMVRNLMEGVKDPCFNPAGLPFNFQKSETLIWAWGNMPMSTVKIVSHVVGRTQGISIRIMKGVYWRTGAFKGERVSREELQPLGSATVAVTSKHLYYSVGTESKRIKHDKIVTITPYSDAVSVTPDGARAKPICFFADDAWFFTNVLQNAQNWA